MVDFCDGVSYKPRPGFFQVTHIPKLGPSHEVWMVDLALRVDVLSGAHHHGLGRGYVDEGRLAGVRVGNPYRYREAIRVCTEYDRYRARNVQEQCAGAVGECWGLCVSII